MRVTHGKLLHANLYGYDIFHSPLCVSIFCSLLNLDLGAGSYVTAHRDDRLLVFFRGTLDFGSSRARLLALAQEPHAQQQEDVIIDARARSAANRPGDCCQGMIEATQSSPSVWQATRRWL